MAYVSGLRATVMTLEARVTEPQDESAALCGEVAQLEAENRALKEGRVRESICSPLPQILPAFLA